MTTSEYAALVALDRDYLDLAVGEEAILDRRGDASAWKIPSNVTLEEDILVFRYGLGRTKSGRRYYLMRGTAQPDGRVLTDFIELAEAPKEKILAYARRYGRLGLCQHNELWHLADDYPDCIQGGRGGSFVEPVERWREYARHARALLNAIAQFSSSGMVSDQTLVALNPKLARSRAALRQVRKAAWSSIGLWTERWLRAARVRPELLYDRSSKRFEIRLRGRPGLASLLALQLLTLSGRSKGIAICSSCAIPFAPKRRPTAGRASYCPKCGTRAAWRDAQHRRRLRTKPNLKA
jgi:predicted RNA-binding Zn-ribbon protein involved in translation (DUF1610 family)